MSCKVGDKVVVEIGEESEFWGRKGYDLTNIEPLSTYTEPLEAKIKNLKKKLKKWVEKGVNQSAEITRLLRENKELKEDFEKSKRVNLNMGRVAGQNEAWELARKIVSDIYHGGYNSDELKEIFGYFLYQNIWEDNTYPEAAAKVAEWEKAKEEEIKVGDVLEEIEDSNVKCVVTKPHSSNMAYLVFSDGSAGLNELDNLRKTGRHIDIDSFLKQIGGENDEK